MLSVQPGLHTFAQKSCLSGWERVRFFCIAFEKKKKKKDVTHRASCQTLSMFEILSMLTLMPKT